MTTQDDLRAAAERINALKTKPFSVVYGDYRGTQCETDRQMLIDAYLATLDERPITEPKLIYVVTEFAYHVGHSKPLAAFTSERDANEFAKSRVTEFTDEFRVAELVVDSK